MVAMWLLDGLLVFGTVEFSKSLKKTESAVASAVRSVRKSRNELEGLINSSRLPVLVRFSRREARFSPCQNAE
jgi:hypothetical protein